MESSLQNSFRDKIDVEHICGQVTFAIRSQFIKPAQHASEPIAECYNCEVCATTNEHTAEASANRVRFPAGSLPDRRMWESCWTMPLGWRVFLGISPLLSPLHSGAAPWPPRFTLAPNPSTLLIEPQLRAWTGRVRHKANCIPSPSAGKLTASLVQSTFTMFLSATRLLKPCDAFPIGMPLASRTAFYISRPDHLVALNRAERPRSVIQSILHINAEILSAVGQERRAAKGLLRQNAFITQLCNLLPPAHAGRAKVSGADQWHSASFLRWLQPRYEVTSYPSEQYVFVGTRCEVLSYCAKIRRGRRPRQQAEKRLSQELFHKFSQQGKSQGDIKRLQSRTRSLQRENMLHDASKIAHTMPAPLLLPCLIARRFPNTAVQAIKVL
ncbi:hypothetical protein PR048_010474 [Dryococelus australis]|uniref:Uncharacterized protein n=1 Tax=Dryococelus australis TaxID=614101 RepID=A0ABQ9I3Y7_9NEOP|nr:hypothetical protein PR048_010474 [Dryococelus australis]